MEEEMLTLQHAPDQRPTAGSRQRRQQQEEKYILSDDVGGIFLSLQCHGNTPSLYTTTPFLPRKTWKSHSQQTSLYMYKKRQSQEEVRIHSFSYSCAILSLEN
ncbi:hypothetical protein OUZ56_007509 [Daphnia magna]|uniref:Uncharacterized protein n=1 Tax=Daphnia magna TaxID=35525 RepID=A0ABR0AA65_9CRUS|nr:hypothetical protein OUZ56_007509 [Daphnia magna]